jgi:hypothetical protein
MREGPMSDATGTGDAAAVDVERLAERVWRLLLEELRRERVRGHALDRPTGS